MTLFGVDVSHHQDPARLGWDSMSGRGCRFAIVRACYGTVRDKRFAEHVSRARAAGMLVGAYLFFRPTESIGAQLDTFRRVTEDGGYGLPGDIVPALDFEADTEKRPVLPSHAPLAEKLLIALHQAFGVPPMLYMTRREWKEAGSPRWAERYPLWCPYWPRAEAAERTLGPPTPLDLPWSIWQHRVGTFNPDGPPGFFSNVLDQNRARYLALLDGTRVSDTTADTDPSPHLDPDTASEEATERALRLLVTQSLETLDLGGASNLYDSNDDEVTKPDGVA